MERSGCAPRVGLQGGSACIGVSRKATKRVTCRAAPRQPRATLTGVSYSLVKALSRHSMRSSNDITARYLYPDFDELLAALTQLERCILAQTNVVAFPQRAAGGTP